MPFSCGPVEQEAMGFFEQRTVFTMITEEMTIFGTLTLHSTVNVFSHLNVYIYPN